MSSHFRPRRKCSSQAAVVANLQSCSGRDGLAIDPSTRRSLRSQRRDYGDAAFDAYG